MTTRPARGIAAEGRIKPNGLIQCRNRLEKEGRSGLAQCTAGASGVRAKNASRRRTGPGVRRKAIRPSDLGSEGRLCKAYVAGNSGVFAWEHGNFLWHACIEPQGATCVVLVRRRRSARHGAGCTRGSICRVRAGACSRRRGGVRRCGGNEACDLGRRSGPITMIVTSVGRGDVGPFRRDGTNVRRTAEALVAICDGARSPSRTHASSTAIEGGGSAVAAATADGAGAKRGAAGV